MFDLRSKTSVVLGCGASNTSLEFCGDRPYRQESSRSGLLTSSRSRPVGYLQSRGQVGAMYCFNISLALLEDVQ